ncbi:MAG: chemotaxis protein CheA [Desulfosarcina sp.]|nr:chemotaxis protein CheA [Desulfobacterales bacterium]
MAAEDTQALQTTADNTATPAAAPAPTMATSTPREYLTTDVSPSKESTAADSPTPRATPETAAPAAESPKIDTENYEEEYDQELFAIFLKQLEEGLATLKAKTAALPDADHDHRMGLLDACLTRIDPLRSSANYMGYAKLRGLYDGWITSIHNARERLEAGDESFLTDFMADYMEANIASVADLFPQVRIPDTTAGKPVPSAEAGETLAVEDETDSESEGPAAHKASMSRTDEEHEATPATVADHASQAEEDMVPDPAGGEKTERVDSSLMNDFLVETVEHLEEMERSLLHLEKDPGHRDTLDDIFRSVHTIKGAAEYLGMERMADLSHRLENLLDQLRREEKPADRDTIDLLMAARDRIGLLTEDLEQSHSEQTSIDDLLERIQNLQNGGSAQTPIETEPGLPVNTAESPSNMDQSDLEIPLFAEYTDNEDWSPVRENPEPSVPDDLAGTDAFQKDVDPEADIAIATDETDLLAEPDRRNPEHSGRRQADRIGEKILKQSIRVDATKIDALMNQVGELVVSRAWFAQLFSEMRNLQQNLKQQFKLDTREMKQIKGLTFRLSEATVALGRVANELQEGVMRVRMLPIAQLFNRYPRLVFDLVRDTDKQVELDIRGEETELDKMVIEKISDPLIHIIRNAVDHGVETVAERRRKGKPETAAIRLEAYHEGNHVVIEIVDDGRGLDLDRIRAKALDGNFISREDIDRMTTKELTGLIMKPGFSTADKVTHTSGRGVGMDVVKKNIEKLNGTIEIDTTPGIETRFRIKIPLTLAIIPALLVKVRRELFTIPLATVEETLRIADDDIDTIEGVEVMQLRSGTLPLVRLDGLFNMAPSSLNGSRAFVVVVSTGMKRVGLVVDDLLGQEEVVIKPLEDYLQEKSGFSGATILGDGRISLILDIYELVNISIDREAQKKIKAAAL